MPERCRRPFVHFCRLSTTEVQRPRNAKVGGSTPPAGTNIRSQQSVIRAPVAQQVGGNSLRRSAVQVRIPPGAPFGTELSTPKEDWFEYRLENDPRFLRRVEQARNNLRAGRGIRLEDLETE